MNKQIIDSIINKDNVQLRKLIYSQNGKINLQESFYEASVNVKNLNAIKILCKKDNREKKLIDYLHKRHSLTPKLLRYLLKCGYKLEPYLFNDYIYSKKYDYFKEIIDYYIFNDELILKLILFHKNKTKLSKKELKEVINYKLRELKNMDGFMDGFGYLIKACQSEDELSVRYLVTLGAQIDSETDIYTSPLTIACQKGNMSLVKCLIDYGADVNKVYGYCQTPLVNAIIARGIRNIKDKNLIGYLIDVGADILKENSQHENALTYSCKYEDISVTNYLLNRLDKIIGAKVKFRDSALLAACQSFFNNNEALIKQLVRQGANVNKVNKDGDTTLMLVIRSSYSRLYSIDKNMKENVIRYLIDQGVDVNRENRNKETALIIACQNNDEKLVNYLIHHGAIVDLNNNKILSIALEFEPIINCLIDNQANIPVNQEILFMACEKNYKNLVKYLIDHGIDVNGTNDDGDSPLIVSCKCSRDSMDNIKYLVEHGAEVNKENPKNETPLSLYLYNREDDKIKYFIDHGADINKGAIKSYITLCERERKVYLNPLLYECSSPSDFSEPLIKSLIEYGADVNYEDRHGFTPLSLLCINYKNRRGMMKYLVGHGADINYENKDGCTPLLWSLKNYGHNINEKIDVLLECGADINKKNKFGDTLLHRVCKFKKMKERELVIEHLIEKGANINQLNQYGGTPLMVACKARAFEAVKCLVDHGADVNIKKKNGKTALFEACSCRQNDESIVKYLIDHGSEMNTTNQNGDTPLIFACKNGRNESIIRCLIESGAKINEKNHHGINALMAARRCSNRNDSIIAYLIEKGCSESG
ncbi:ankyrin [Neocallimastix lanati (nom. inval.)]|nr:ankyrin [Neocallimastix sp. JGI-2020a]